MNTANSQYKYSIDIKNKHDRHVPIKFTVEQTLEQVKVSWVHNKEKRIESRNSRKIRKHIYRIQSHEVKKRMRRSKRKAENFNRGKVPLGVKLKNCFKWMI